MIRTADLRAWKRENIKPLTYEGKALRGWVRHLYRPEIAVTDPGQIEVVD